MIAEDQFVIYLGFTNRIIMIILTKECGQNEMLFMQYPPEKI